VPGCEQQRRRCGIRRCGAPRWSSPLVVSRPLPAAVAAGVGGGRVCDGVGILRGSVLPKDPFTRGDVSQHFSEEFAVAGHRVTEFFGGCCSGPAAFRGLVHALVFVDGGRGCDRLVHGIAAVGHRLGEEPVGGGDGGGRVVDETLLGARPLVLVVGAFALGEGAQAGGGWSVP